MTRRAAAPRQRAFAGWWVVTGAFLVVMAGFGAIYSYAAFAEEIAAAFGASPVSVAFVYALSGGTCFLVSALSGPLADRLGPRVPALVGMMLVALGLLVAATAGSLVEIYAGYGLLIGLGTGFAYVPAMAAVQRWFTTHRGIASGIAASGIGVGTALVPPAAEALQGVFDWRATFVAFGCLVAVLGGLGALLLEPGGLRGPPRGRTPHTADAAPPPRSAPGRRAFALAWIGTLLVSVPATLPHAMLAGTARDVGLSRADALALLGLIGLGTIAGRFLIAAVADAIGRRATFVACCAGMSGSMLVWAFAGDAASLRIFALVFGALQGGFVALLPAFCADSFGARSIGGVLGLLYTSRGVALLVAPPAVAALLVGIGHGPPLVAVAALGAAGSLMLARLPRLPDPPVESAPSGAVPAAARAGVLAAALLGAVVAAGPARAEDGFASFELVWSTPAPAPDAARGCARLLLLNIPEGWQSGDAAAVVMAPEGRGFDIARPLVGALLAQQAAVLELPSGQGGGVGACAAVPAGAVAQFLGALSALRAETGAGVVVAIGLGDAGPAALAAAREAVAARLLGAGGPRFAFAAALGGARPALFEAGAPPPPEERWSDRAPLLCAALRPFAGGGDVGACGAAALQGAR